MKYGKKYLETLQAPGIPEEWRQQAIEYRQLKKVINRVATELKELGLTSEVLKDLLAQNETNNSHANANANAGSGTASTSHFAQESEPHSVNGPRPGRRRSNTIKRTSTASNGGSPLDDLVNASEADSKLEAAVRIEQVADQHESPLAAHLSWRESAAGDSSEDGSSSQQQDEEDDHVKTKDRDLKERKRKANHLRLRRARASYELAGDSANPEPRIHIVFSSASSGSISESSIEGGEDGDDHHQRGGGSSDSIGAHVRSGAFSRRASSSNTDSPGDGDEGSQRFTELVDSSEDDLHPSLHQYSKNGLHQPDGSDSLDETTSSGGGEGLGTPNTDDLDFEGAGPQANALLKKMYGLEIGASPSEESEAEADRDPDHGLRDDWANIGVQVEPPTLNQNSVPLRQRRKSDETLRREDISVSEYDVLATPRAVSRKKPIYPIVDINDGRDAEADDEGDRRPKRKRRRHIPHQPRKEVFIPLNKDNEFLGLLAKALASLAALQIAQKRQFTTAVELLAREVSNVSSPSRPRSDLYIWREIFSLWVEAQIFESARERDRGERTVEAVEEKLNWFVDQVAKRKLAKRMKHKESRSALEQFIQLNVELLDMKRFQLANEEAARKILKKHDKRTALTASLGFPKFIAAASDLSASTSPDNPNSRVLTLPGFPSLPHVLLSTFTSTLLPIIPQLEDYECAICGEVAFKPIKLECGHKFCVRCLVKMQKRGQDNCPQCRSPVVLRANAANLDTAMQTYLQMWFPKEVKAKAKSNRKEAAKEELEEMGLVDHRCSIM